MISEGTDLCSALWPKSSKVKIGNAWNTPRTSRSTGWVSSIRIKSGVSCTQWCTGCHSQSLSPKHRGAYLLSHSVMSDSLGLLWTVAHKAPLSMGFFRQEYWSGLPFPPPSDLPNSGIVPPFPTSPALAGGFSTTAHHLESPRTEMQIKATLWRGRQVHRRNSPLNEILVQRARLPSVQWQNSKCHPRL